MAADLSEGEERVAAVAYQVVAFLLAKSGHFGHPEAVRILDWLSDPEKRRVDPLPWPEPADLGPPSDFAAERVERLERDLAGLRPTARDPLAALREPTVVLLEATAKAHCWAIGCETCARWQDCGWVNERARQDDIDEARIVLGIVAAVLDAETAPGVPPKAQEGRSGDGTREGNPR